MAEAIFLREPDVFREIVPTAGYTSGEVIQLADGRAAYVTSQESLVENQWAGLKVDGVVKLAKTASQVWVKGAPIYWDRSASTATPILAKTGGDFFIGTAADDATSSATTGEVNLNVAPVYQIDLLRDPCTTVIVGSAPPSISYYPGFAKLLFTTATEAQKVDMLSDASFLGTQPFVLEGKVNIDTNGDNAAFDLNFGLANDTHASDADTITESVFFHVNGSDTNIYAESDNAGVAEVAATDTTVDFTAGTEFDFCIDGRVLSDIQMYINGVLVLGSSTFTLASITGPLKLLVHMEKTSDDSPGQLNVMKFAVRLTDVIS
jgi:predicted RecA/RadA family phage recombinase